MFGSFGLAQRDPNHCFAHSNQVDSGRQTCKPFACVTLAFAAERMQGCLPQKDAADLFADELSWFVTDLQSSQAVEVPEVVVYVFQRGLLLPFNDHVWVTAFHLLAVVTLNSA